MGDYGEKKPHSHLVGKREEFSISALKAVGMTPASRRGAVLGRERYPRRGFVACAATRWELLWDPHPAPGPGDASQPWQQTWGSQGTSFPGAPVLSLEVRESYGTNQARNAPLPWRFAALVKYSGGKT